MKRVKVNFQYICTIEIPFFTAVNIRHGTETKSISTFFLASSERTDWGLGGTKKKNPQFSSTFSIQYFALRYEVSNQICQVRGNVYN